MYTEQVEPRAGACRAHTGAGGEEADSQQGNTQRNKVLADTEVL